MPAEQFVVTGNVDGNEHPSGGRLFTLLHEAEPFADEVMALPGARNCKIERVTPGAAGQIIKWLEPPSPPPVEILQTEARDGFLITLDGEGNELGRVPDPRQQQVGVATPAPHLTPHSVEPLAPDHGTASAWGD